MFRFAYLNDAPLISVADSPELDGNANGASLIAAPQWIDRPLGRYLLYFAHHQGAAIRLAVSDNLSGPWTIHSTNPLELEQSHFATKAADPQSLDPGVRADIASGSDGDYPHIASPDIWLDQHKQQIRMYYHGRLNNGLQRTRVALSSDGVNFEAQQEILGLPYFKLFKHQDWFYAIAMPGQLYRSRDGLSQFESGPQLTTEPIRHHALLAYQNKWYFFFTRVGDIPERILVSELDTCSDWYDWKLGPSYEVHRPRRNWEGADVTLEASRYGSVMHRVNQLRDPAIFEEDGKIYLLYAIAGEQGIAMGELIYG